MALEVPNFILPDAIPVPNPLENTLTLNDSETSLVSWDAPQKSGHYVIAIKIESYREGALHDVIIRDMMITVDEAEHLNPSITCSEESTEVIEVNIGDTITVDVEATGWDTNLSLSLTASCGLFEDDYEHQAEFDATTSGAEGSGTFTWVVKEEHARQQPYQLVFKARDNFGNTEEGVAQYKYLHYRVTSDLVAVDEPTQSSIIEIFPNPTKDEVRVMAAPDSGIIGYEIVNAGGKLIKTGFLNTSQAISLYGMPDGLYILRLRKGSTWEAFKLIKQQ